MAHKRQHGTSVFRLTLWSAPTPPAICIVFVLALFISQLGHGESYALLDSFAEHGDGAYPVSLTINKAGNL
jgi:hypothetical protein